MDAPEAPLGILREEDDVLEVRYLGAFSHERYLRQMEWSVAACLERGRRLLLVDITGLEGYRPTTLERHQIGTAGAELSRNLDRVAVVGTPEQLADTFATQVAQNRGLWIRLFHETAQALDWLRSPRA